MGYASRSGHAITNPQSPRAFAECDACGRWWNHHKLRYKIEWQGTRLVNLRYLVCESCWDQPNQQLKSKRPPPDPIPIRDPRPSRDVYPFDTSVVTTESPPGPSVMTIETGVGNFPAGAPMEIEP